MKLPLNLLLTVAIVALLGAIGLQFKGLAEDRSRLSFGQDAQLANAQALAKRFEDGQLSAGEANGGPNYAEPIRFWDAFAKANFNGKLPPPPPEQQGDGPGDQNVPPPPPPKVPLTDIFQVICIVFDGDQSRIVLQYKPESNVQPPEDVVAGAQPGVGGFVRDTTPQQPRRGGPGTPPRGSTPRPPGFPAAPATGVYFQQLEVGGALWPPHGDIRLVRVADDASHALFARAGEDVPRESWEEEPVYPEVLGLQQDVLRQLEEGLRIGRQGGTRAEPERAPVIVQPTDWQPTERTTEVGRGRFNIGTRDRELFRSDPNRIFNEDIGTASYRSATGNIEGVRITRLAPGYESYGVQEGEIVIAVNGEPVRNKAEGIRVGKRLYERGVRTFEIDFLSSGRRITRTYVAPEN
ncbi:MAG: hypothetical protein IPM29_11310 [Planctomycetes bacterium]|nr:hypothetical protein [Planctomycetota bacterium]